MYWGGICEATTHSAVRLKGHNPRWEMTLEARRKQIKSKKLTGKIKDKWFQFGQYSGQPISLPLVVLENKI